MSVMPSAATDFDDRVSLWWRWFAVALFLLLPLDLLTTLVAIDRYGTAVEANPLMRWVLRQGLVVTTLVHLVVLVIAVWLFYVTINAVRRVPLSDRPTFVRLIDGWIGLLILFGGLLVVNNLSTIA